MSPVRSSAQIDEPSLAFQVSAKTAGAFMPDEMGDDRSWMSLVVNSLVRNNKGEAELIVVLYGLHEYEGLCSPIVNT